MHSELQVRWKMKVLYAITEADPFIKTGGLGEVGGSLPAALKELGIDIRVILPKYTVIPEKYKRKMKLIRSFTVALSWRNQYCGLEELYLNGIHYYFIDNEYYFKRTNVYGETDESEQYAFFCRAILESIPYIPEFKPDLIHCNDWHTAMIPLMLKEFYAQEPFYYNIKTIFTIHNLKYQGIYDKEVLGDVLGLGVEYYTPDKLEFHGRINFMKAGLIYADRITTVSPTYASEIQYFYYGEGLEGILKERKDTLLGILNGIDIYKYEIRLEDKPEHKKRLQSTLRLPLRSEIPILSIVSRLVSQKGLDLLAHVLEEILEQEVQFVVLGTGEPQYEEMFREFAFRYPHKLSAQITYNDELAQLIFAGSDIFLMPSQFEPCGIAQMIAMHLGAIPVVRETGGLKDTVIPFVESTGEGNGFNFAHYNAHDFLFTVQHVIRLFRENKTAWNSLQKNATQTDFSWRLSAEKYFELYESLYY